MSSIATIIAVDKATGGRGQKLVEKSAKKASCKAAVRIRKEKKKGAKEISEVLQDVCEEE